MRRFGALVAALLIVLAGCGSDDAGITDAAADALRPRVEEIRQLAGQRKADEVLWKLSELRSTVTELVRRGELSDQAARDVEAAADAVQRELALITTTTTTTTTTAPPPPRRRGDGEEDDDEDREEEKKGKDEEDG